MSKDVLQEHAVLRADVARAEGGVRVRDAVDVGDTETVAQNRDPVARPDRLDDISRVDAQRGVLEQLLQRLRGDVLRREGVEFVVQQLLIEGVRYPRAVGHEACGVGRRVVPPGAGRQDVADGAGVGLGGALFGAGLPGRADGRGSQGGRQSEREDEQGGTAHGRPPGRKPHSSPLSQWPGPLGNHECAGGRPVPPPPRRCCGAGRRRP